MMAGKPTDYILARKSVWFPMAQELQIILHSSIGILDRHPFRVRFNRGKRFWP